MKLDDASRHERLHWLIQILRWTHAVSDTISPWTPVKPSVPAATAAAAMVLTLFGASGHSSATEPLYKTRLPSPSVQSERMSPVSRKQDGCLDILINKAWNKSMNQCMITDPNPNKVTVRLPLRYRTTPVLPSRLHYRSASECPGRPTMHHWGRIESYYSGEQPDAASGSDQGQREQKENQPEEIKDTKQDAIILWLTMATKQALYQLGCLRFL